MPYKLVLRPGQESGHYQMAQYLELRSAVNLVTLRGWHKHDVAVKYTIDLHSFQLLLEICFKYGIA